MIKIVNVETGEIIERELNAEELAQQAIDEAVFNAEQEARQVKAAQRQAILDRLGLSAEEATLLLGGN